MCAAARGRTRRSDPAHAGHGGVGAVVVGGAVVVVVGVVVVVVVVVGRGRRRGRRRRSSLSGVGGTVAGVVVAVGPAVGGGVGDDEGDSAEPGRALVAIVSVLRGRTMVAISGPAVAMILGRGRWCPTADWLWRLGGIVVDVLVGVGSGGVTIAATAMSGSSPPLSIVNGRPASTTTATPAPTRATTRRRSWVSRRVIPSRAMSGPGARRAGRDAERLGVARCQPLELLVGACGSWPACPASPPRSVTSPQREGDVDGPGGRILPGPITGGCIRDANRCRLTGRIQPFGFERSFVPDPALRSSLHHPQRPGYAEAQGDEAGEHQEREAVEGERRHRACQARGRQRLPEIADGGIPGSVTSSPAEEGSREEVDDHDRQPDESDLDGRHEILVVEDDVAVREEGPGTPSEPG